MSPAFTTPSLLALNVIHVGSFGIFEIDEFEVEHHIETLSFAP